VRPLVVIESRHWPAAAAQAAALEDAGMRPVLCTGPTADGGACPLLVDEHCPVLDEADAVVYDLDLDREGDLEVLRALLRDHGGLPVVTERSRGEQRRHAAALRQCTVVRPISPGHTATAVVAALTRGEHRDPP
jgi:hypothetical protein